MKKKLTIELLSPLACGDGESMLGIIDSDVCYDDVGIPFIPSKRIKGCLLEIAYEVSQDNQLIENVFGTMGSQEKGSLIIKNGYIEDYKNAHALIKRDIEDEKIFEQDVIEYFTSVRTQTTINEHGSAKKTSLRTMRILNKELKFEFDVFIDNDKEYKLLQKCCKVFKNMGVKRSRGFGNIKCSIEDVNGNVKEEEIIANEEETIVNKDKIYYLLTLESKVIMSDRGSDYESCNDYISGNSILGYFADRFIKRYSEEEFRKVFFESNIKFSNAYITHDEKHEYIPAPLCFVKEKDNENRYHNIAIQDPKIQDPKIQDPKIQDPKIEDLKVQIKSLKNAYISLIDYKTFTLLEPNFEIEYHHSRPLDKGIGKTLGSEDGNFLETGQYYQFKVLSKGQKFVGSIEGNKDTLEKILKLLPCDNIITIGRSRTSQYGSVRFDILKDGIAKQEDIKINKGDAFILNLISPMILHDEMGNIVADYKLFLKEIESYGEEIDAFLSYKIISGYNSQWGFPKPQIQALDMGSVIVLEAKKEFKSSELDNMIFGMQQDRGFGRVRVLKVDKVDKNGTSIIRNQICHVKDEKYIKSELVDKIIEKINLKKDESKIISQAMDYAKDVTMPNSTTIGRLTAMLNSVMFNDGMDDKKDKKKYCRFIVKDDKGNCKKNCKFIDMYDEKDAKESCKFIDIHDEGDEKKFCEFIHIIGEIADKEKMNVCLNLFKEGKKSMLYARTLLEELKLKQRREKLGKKFSS